MRRSMPGTSPTFQVWVLTSSQSIYSIKQTLRNRGFLDQKTRIFSNLNKEEFRHFTCAAPLPDANYPSALPTTIFLESSLASEENDSNHLLEELGLASSSVSKLAVGTRDPSAPGPATTPRLCLGTNCLSTSVYKWLLALPQNLQSFLPVPISDLISAESWTYQKYPPLLLLPPKAFKSAPWIALLSSPLEAEIPSLYACICDAMDVTHIAINAPIPLSVPAASQDPLITNQTTQQDNILRSPTAIAPLHGDFGCSTAEPTIGAFKEALWVSARQNGVQQIFAPLHTMFSKGNISEKQRVLGLPCLYGMEGGSTAVDLYAGIGYFAFMYAKAGVDCVLGWEINGWSVEGFRRGAKANGWPVGIVEGDKSMVGGGEGEEKEEEDWVEAVKKNRLIMFAEDNHKAPDRIQKLRDHIPPVRHVNCGFLPSSKHSWDAAVQILDPKEGGWIHAHENVAQADIKTRKSEVEALFTALANSRQVHHTPYTVTCEHVERVKSYAPGVLHCVFDIRTSAASSISTPPLTG